jgi:hypothetical protein
MWITSSLIAIASFIFIYNSVWGDSGKGDYLLTQPAEDSYQETIVDSTSIDSIAVPIRTKEK